MILTKSSNYTLSCIDSYPFVSILIAARNEQKYIGECLRSILSQTYPSECFEVIVANDNSSDLTGEIVSDLIKINNNLSLVNVTSSIGHLVGKTNAIEHAIRKAKGDFYIFFDADVIVPKEIIAVYVKQLFENCDMLSGGVSVKSDTLFGKLQNAGYIKYTSECAKKSNLGKPITAMGANMAMSRSVYQSVGGYLRIPYSVTEDYELFRLVITSGYRFRAIFDKQTVVKTHPHLTFSEFLKQRRRWLTGTFQSKLKYRIMFNINNLQILYFIILCFINPIMSMVVFLFCWIQDIISLKKSFSKIDHTENAGLYLYYPYSIICNFIFIFFQFFKTKVTWKDRYYSTLASDQ